MGGSYPGAGKLFEGSIMDTVMSIVVLILAALIAGVIVFERIAKGRG